MIDKIKRAKLAISKLKTQIHNSNESTLMFAVVEQAIRDAALPKLMQRNKKTGKKYDVNSTNRTTGRSYLLTGMPHAQLAGLDPNWIRLVLKKAAIKIN